MDFRNSVVGEGEMQSGDSSSFSMARDGDGIG